MTNLPPEWIDKAALAACDAIECENGCDTGLNVARAVLAAVADDLRPTVNRDDLAGAIAEANACGCCDGSCGACQEEVDSLIASGIWQDAAVVAARTRREVAEEIAQAIRHGGCRVVGDAVRIARAAADQDEAGSAPNGRGVGR